VSGGVEEYRAEPGSGGIIAGGQTNIFPVDVVEDRSRIRDVVHVKDSLQVAICEPVEVDDGSGISGERIDNTERIFVRWTSL